MVAEAESKPQRGLYFVNAGVDFALIGGASIALYLALRFLGDGARTEAVWRTSAALAWIVNWPHFSATSYRLYHSRDNIRQYPLTAVVIPLVLASFAVGAILLPEQLAPPLVKMFLIWSPYHFSGQTLGISLIYARRAGFAIARWERMALSGFIYGTFLVQTASAEAGMTSSSFYAVTMQPLGLSPWVPQLLRAGMALCGVVFLAALARRAVLERRVPPAILLLPAVTQFTWFVLGSGVASFNEFVPFFHALQYLLIAWAMQLKEKMDTQAIEPSPGYAWSESARWGALNLLGGVVLFWALPRLCSDAGIELPLAMAVMLASVQLHHFFVDGVIWKLKNPRVSSPLLVNIADIAGTARAPQRQVASA